MSAAAPRADRVRLTPETHEALFAEALRRIDPAGAFKSITAAERHTEEMGVELANLVRGAAGDTPVVLGTFAAA